MDENTLKAIEVIGQISKDSMSVANNHMSVANNHMSVANNYMAVANKALDTIAAIAGLHRPAIQAPPPSLSQPISEQDLEAEIARNKENTKESP